MTMNSYKTVIDWIVNLEFCYKNNKLETLIIFLIDIDK